MTEKWRSQIPKGSVVFASFEFLRAIVTEGQYRAFVWPDEGEFGNETWHFNAKHVGKFEPLMLDRQTANAMLTLHDALNEQNQAKFKDWLAKGRAEFGALVEMTWERVKLKPAA